MTPRRMRTSWTARCSLPGMPRDRQRVETFSRRRGTLRFPGPRISRSSPSGPVPPDAILFPRRDPAGDRRDGAGAGGAEHALRDLRGRQRARVHDRLPDAGVGEVRGAAPAALAGGPRGALARAAGVEAVAAAVAALCAVLRDGLLPVGGDG